MGFEDKKFNGMSGKGWRLLNKDEKFIESDEHIGWGGYSEGWLPIGAGLLGMTLDEVMFTFARRAT